MPRYKIYFTYLGRKEVEVEAESKPGAEIQVRERYAVKDIVSIDEIQQIPE